MDAMDGRADGMEIVEGAGSGPEEAAVEADVTVEAPGESGGNPANGAGDDAGGGGTAEALRELVLKAHPDVVPEMVAGETLEDLLASVPGARAAYQRISESLAHPEAISAGGATRSTPLDITAMPAMLKIREGLKA